MNFFTFSAHFGDENASREHFKPERDKIGVVCQRCGCKNHYWIKSR